MCKPTNLFFVLNNSHLVQFVRAKFAEFSLDIILSLGIVERFMLFCGFHNDYCALQL
jgi:hypothetical protein